MQHRAVRDWTSSTLKERLDHVRELSGGISQNRLGAEAGIEGGPMSKLMTRPRPSAEKLAAIATRWGVSLLWLTTGTGQPRDDEPTPAREVVLDPRYPERSAAIAAVVALGATEDDAQRWADEAAVALDSEEDPERGWWVRRMLARRDETRKLAASLAAQQADEAKRERDTAAATEKTRPKLPARK